MRLIGKNLDHALNIAHRGARAFAPENTLAAFEKAKVFGCPMFEIDVHQSKDGELVVHHDDQLTRCTDVKSKFPGRSSYFIADFTCDELLSLDAGSWYVEQLSFAPKQRQPFLQTLTDQEIEQFVGAEDLTLYGSGEISIPTLKQTLELAKKLDLMVNIELKTLPRMYPGIAEAVLELIDDLAMEQQVLISSFDHLQLQIVRQRNQGIATAVLTGDRLANAGNYLTCLDADAYHPSCDSLGFSSVSGLLDAETISSLRQAGFGVNVWTCNDKADMKRLRALGVSGLISDYPNRVREVLVNPT